MCAELRVEDPVVECRNLHVLFVLVLTPLVVHDMNQRISQVFHPAAQLPYICFIKVKAEEDKPAL